MIIKIKEKKFKTLKISFNKLILYKSYLKKN